MSDLAEFTEKLRKLSERVVKLKDILATEEATKTALIMPFFQALGYDVFNPAEFTPEVIADIGIKKGEKVDYAILKDGEPVILVECKPVNMALDKFAGQLIRYYVAKRSAKFGILTNGETYKFYTDLEEKNIMDDAPFLEFSLLNIKKNQIPEIAKFQKSEFDIDSITNAASDLRNMELIRTEFSNVIEDPDDDFVRYIIKGFYKGQKTQNALDQFRPLVKRTISQYINELMNDRLSSALNKVDEKEKQEQLEETSEETDPTMKSKVVTTDFELECFAILRAILCEVTEVSRIHYQDKETYFAVLLDNKVTRWICRLYSNQTTSWLTLREEGIRFDFSEPSELYKAKADIIKSFQAVDPQLKES